MVLRVGESAVDCFYHVRGHGHAPVAMSTDVIFGAESVPRAGPFDQPRYVCFFWGMSASSLGRYWHPTQLERIHESHETGFSPLRIAELIFDSPYGYARTRRHSTAGKLMPALKDGLKDLIRRVNQQLLLKELYDTRICSSLLVLPTKKDVEFANAFVEDEAEVHDKLIKVSCGVVGLSWLLHRHWGLRVFILG